MRYLFLGAISGLGLFVAIDGAHAVDLINEDTRSYAVVITEEDQVRKVRLDPGASLDDVCRQCTIAIPNVGEIMAQPGDIIIIRNGEIEVSS